MKTMEKEYETDEEWIQPGELRYLAHTESVIAIHNLIRRSVNILVAKRTEGTVSLPQQDLAQHIAELACSSVRDANVGILIGLDQGDLVRLSNRQISLPDTSID